MTASAVRVGETLAAARFGATCRRSRAGDATAEPPESTEPRAFRLTDSTLRDGSHALRHQFTPRAGRRPSPGALDAAGVPVIEVSHGDGLGGSSFNYGFSAIDERELIARGRRRGHAARKHRGPAAARHRPRRATCRGRATLGVVVARIATHCTEADIAIQHLGRRATSGWRPSAS